MKSLLIVLIVLAVSVTSFGQEKASLSRIKLKDGSEFTAKIVENRPGNYIKISISGNQTSTIYYEAIESIKDKSYSYHSKFMLPQGLYFDGSYAFLFGRSGGMNDLRVGMALGGTANYRFNPYLETGVGVEISVLYVNGNYLLVPMFARISGSVVEKRISPYYQLDMGWSTASTGNISEQDLEMKGGLFLRPSIGIRFNNVKVGFAYQVQNIETSYQFDLWRSGNELVEEKRVMRNLSIGASVIF